MLDPLYIEDCSSYGLWTANFTLRADANVDVDKLRNWQRTRVTKANISPQNFGKYETL